MEKSFEELHQQIMDDMKSIQIQLNKINASHNERLAMWDSLDKSE